MFDPYHKWLGIPAEFRPPTYYQLLGISPQEQDRDVIDAAVLRQSAYVRNFQSGRYGADATRILTEIAAAKLCLLNPIKRGQYDAELKRQRAEAERLDLAPEPDLDGSRRSPKESPPKRASNAASPDVPLDLAPDPELDRPSHVAAPKAAAPAKPAPSAVPSTPRPGEQRGPPPRAVTDRSTPLAASLLDLDKLPGGRGTRSSTRGFSSQPRLGARRRKPDESPVPYGLLAALAGALLFVVLVIVYLRTRPPLPMTPEMLRKMEANEAQFDGKRPTP
ncbi:MAG TPA: hypothetical protein VMV69_04950 [Pirellulales bacterium]|nr:hypothetical protein [Pirellulales bacterium]